MRRSLALLTALAILAWLPSAGHAQSTPEPTSKPAAGAAAAGEEAASAVDPGVLDRCRQRADSQKLREGPERKAFMGTCLTPED
ncbi:PsiF family protein [Methylobacterium sp. J-088]|uniref:PsiF family protein n=1 Tax=Methylobacterium sp. J-088 TaxID=2836664 RepID=UPI0039199137